MKFHEANKSDTLVRSNEPPSLEWATRDVNRRGTVGGKNPAEGTEKTRPYQTRDRQERSPEVRSVPHSTAQVPGRSDHRQALGNEERGGRVEGSAGREHSVNRCLSARQGNGGVGAGKRKDPTYVFTRGP